MLLTATAGPSRRLTSGGEAASDMVRLWRQSLANPVKAKLVTSARDYYWSSFRSFYEQGDVPLAVDHDWWWPDDAEKLHKAMKEMGRHSYWKRDGNK